MFIRKINSQFFWYSLRGGLFCASSIVSVIVGGSRAAAAGESPPAAVTFTTLPKVGLNQVELTRFSSVTGKAICRVNAGKVLPASKRSGPFVMPLPGYEIRQVTIDIMPENCTEKDWEILAKLLVDLRRFTLRESITVRLLDESGKNPAGVWQVSGVPAWRASAAGEGGGALLFSSRDTGNVRVPLLLFRDNSSGTLVFQAPPPRPGLPKAAQ